jgi:hypothetical protein
VVTRGQVIGRIVKFAGIPPHLHLALGERRNNMYNGVDLYDYFKATINTEIVLVVRFFQNGNAPRVVDFRSAHEREAECYRNALSAKPASEYANQCLGLRANEAVMT